MKTYSILTSILSLVVLVSPSLEAAPPPKSPPVSAYIHSVVTTGASANLCQNDPTGSSTVLNNALANGNPNAVVVATWNTGNTSGTPTRITVPGPIYVFYDGANTCGNALNRWVLVNTQPWLTTPAVGFTGSELFNVVVVAP